jgi:hypothetical protein
MTIQGGCGAIRRSLVLMVATGVMLLASPLCVFAQTSNPTPEPASTQPSSNTEKKPWWKVLTFDGFLSASYTFNQNAPDSKQNQFRVFDYKDDTPTFDVAELVIQRVASKPKDLGFRIDFTAGSTVPEMTAAYGMFRNKHTGQAGHVDIHQLFLSYILPAGKGLRVDFGKFVTHMGYEVIEGYDGYNDNYSRGFLFGYGIPYTHTGVKASYPFSDKISGMLMVTNGWDDVHNNNRSHSVGAQLAVTPRKGINFYFNFIEGPECPRDNHDLRSVYELVGVWKATPKLNFAVDGLYGHEENAVSMGHDALWKAFAGYAKYNFTSRFSLAFRGEAFADNGGTRTAVVQTLHGFTLTPEYDLFAKPSHLSPHLKKLDGMFVLRGDLRLDRSNKNVFQTGSELRRRQFTTAINLLYYF